MAIVKTVKGGISSSRYLNTAIEYSKNPDKTNIGDDAHLANALQYAGKQEKALYISSQNCTTTNTYSEWEKTRNQYKKNNGRLAHHFIQSFSPTENVTPEQVHQMGLELAKRCFPDYQVLICTHIDRNHLHNHIIVNSCNINNGLKWCDNNKTLNFVRYTNDKIAIENGCSIIDSYIKNGSAKTTDKFKQSYKVDMAKAVRESLLSSVDRFQFERSMKEKGYTVRFGKQITFREIANTKHAARGEVLAKQFGAEFSTKSIYAKFGIDIEINEYVKKAVDKNGAKKTEKELDKINAYKFTPDKRFMNGLKAEEGLISNGNPNSRYAVTELKIAKLEEKLKRLEGKPFNVKALVAYLYIRADLFNKKIYSKFAKKYLDGNVKTAYKVNRIPYRYKDGKATRVFGNISFKSLMMKNGDNVSVKVDARLLQNLINAPFFYYASIDEKSGAAKVLCKEKDANVLFNALGIKPEIKSIQKKEYNTNKVRLANWKKNNVPLLWNNKLTLEDVKRIRTEGVPYALYEKENGFSVVYPQQYEDNVYSAVYPERSLVNGRTKKSVLDDLAKSNNTDLSYKVISQEQFRLLQESKAVDIPSIGYEQKDMSGKINLCYLSTDEQKLKNVILSEYDALLDNKPYREWKRHNLSVNWIYDLSVEQVKSLKTAGCEISVFSDKNDSSRFCICTPFYEYNNVMGVLDDTYNPQNGTMSYADFKQIKADNQLDTVTFEISAEQLNAFRHLKESYPISNAFKKQDGSYMLSIEKKFSEEIISKLKITQVPFKVQLDLWKKNSQDYHCKYNLSEEDVKKLSSCDADYVVAKSKSGEYIIAYPAYNEREIFTHLYPDKNPVTCNIERKDLQNYAEGVGEKIEYMFISPTQYDALTSDTTTEIMSTAFENKNGKGYNFWYLASDKPKVMQIINNTENRPKSVIDTMKARGANIVTKKVTPTQFERLKKSGVECAFSKDGETIAYDVTNHYLVLSEISKDAVSIMRSNGIEVHYRKGINVDTVDMLISSKIPFSFAYNKTDSAFAIAYAAKNEKEILQIIGADAQQPDKSDSTKNAL